MSLLFILPLAGEHCRVEFDNRCAEEMIEVDRAQMEQVFQNLLKNALETGASEIGVKVCLSDNERWLIVSIMDNGGGFSQTVADNLFTPFYTTKPGGQGIGLAVCRQIVSNHTGLVGAESVDANGGARFTVRLPMRR